ncbi:MAG: polyribonucleotide nucleotidyltransferase [Chitinophagales bacterium]
MIKFNTHSIELPYNQQHKVTIETGKLARQANGSVLLKCGNCMILATVCASPEAKPDAPFFPLMVDYQEKFASSGRIPGSFHRREGRLSEHEILISRLVDRAIRPLFPDNYMNDTQVLIYLISNDESVDPDSLAGLAASTALSISDIPFQEAISEVRIIKLGEEYIVNPSPAQQVEAKLNIILAGTHDNILMVEGEADECSEQDLIDAIKTGHQVIQAHCKAQVELRSLCGKEKMEVAEVEVNEALKQKIADFAETKIYEVAKNPTGKHERKAALKAIKEELLTTFTEEELEEQESLIGEYFAKLEKETIRNMVLNDRVRLDGRQTTEIRPISVEIDVLPSPHGSALFTRGETQSLTTITLGSKQDEQMVDKAQALEFSDFMLHYNFPPFSTGEVKPMRGTSRREVGHGNLAMRSIKQILPSKENNPYTIRIVSDILESNGSSSMATVCAASLALMDTGVKVKRHVSGIAMGMISKGEKYAILSDILGDEDHLGDMDFKVTGTKNGICACQMDIKVDGLSYEVLTEALEQAKQGRLHILNIMDECINTPRSEYKTHVPRIEMITVHKDFIGAIIGPGGKVIQELQAKTNTTITIEEDKEKGIGLVYIMSNNAEGMQKAMDTIKGIIAVPEVGEVYDAKVVSIMPYGAFVEFLPGKQGLLHVSEIAHQRVEKVEDFLKEGEAIKVKLVEIDKKTGKFKLSKKALEPKAS